MLPPELLALTESSSETKTGSNMTPSNIEEGLKNSTQEADGAGAAVGDSSAKKEEVIQNAAAQFVDEKASNGDTAEGS